MTKPKQTESLIDDCFWVKRQRWGTFVSVHKDGHEIITSLREDVCVAATRDYLKQKQEGVFTEGTVTYTGTVDGKL